MFSREIRKWRKQKRFCKKEYKETDEEEEGEGNGGQPRVIIFCFEEIYIKISQ